jgi:hypothetical protein
MTDYVNISNATLINVSASFGSTTEWLEQRRAYFGRATHSPPPAPPPTDANPAVERPFFFDPVKGTRIDIPMLDHDNDIQEAFTDDTDDTDFKMRYVTSTKLAARYTIAGKERGDPEEMPKDYFHRAACGDEEATLVKVHVRILLQPHTFVDSRTDFFMRVYGGTLDAAFKRFDVRSCFTETTENQRLECDPAPSPPPPDNWVTPPSPPAYVYEALTLATATGSSALFFVISAVCCIGIGGRTIRARHNSRMIGTPGLSRVDRMPTLPARYERHGEEFTGPFRPDHQQPGARLAPTSSGFSFSGLTARYNPVSSQ